MKNHAISFFLISLIAGIFCCMMWTLNSRNFLTADDLCRAAKFVTPSKILTTSVSEYVTWSGRFWVTVLSYLMLQNVLLWRFLNPILATSLLVLILSLFSKDKLFSKTNVIPFLALVSFFFTIDLSISLSVFYWLSGSLNYLWPITFVFAFISLWTLFLSKGKPSGRAFEIVLLILSIAAGSSQEQAGLIAIIFVIGTLAWREFVEHKDVHIIHIIVLLGVTGGFLSLMFAPGNLLRMINPTQGDQLYFLNDLSGRLTLRLQEVLNTSKTFMSLITLEIILLSGVILDIFFGKKRNVKKGKTFLYTVLLIPFLYNLVLQLLNTLSLYDLPIPFQDFVQLNNFLSPIQLVPYIFLVMFIFGLILYAIDVCKTEKEPFLLLLFISLFASQGLMIFAPSSPPRTFFITVILLWSSIIYIYTHLDRKGLKLLLNILVLCTSVGIWGNFTILRNNFSKNITTNNVNELAIWKFDHNIEKPEIFLSKLPYDTYIFDMPYSDQGLYFGWQDECFKDYYRIDNKVKIIWTDYSEKKK